MTPAQQALELLKAAMSGGAKYFALKDYEEFDWERIRDFWANALAMFEESVPEKRDSPGKTGHGDPEISNPPQEP